MINKNEFSGEAGEGVMKCAQAGASHGCGWGWLPTSQARLLAPLVSRVSLQNRGSLFYKYSSKGRGWGPCKSVSMAFPWRGM